MGGCPHKCSLGHSACQWPGGSWEEGEEAGGHGVDTAPHIGGWWQVRGEHVIQGACLVAAS